MKICPTKTDIRHCVKSLRDRGKTIALVPTMGYLHDGHLALVARAAQASDAVIATIFVNPTQFGPNEDLATYPRDMERDLSLLKSAGVAGVFTPTPDEMYAPDADTIVDVPSLSGIMQGALRPGHFRGVTTVVSKLFNITQPDVAVFGEKDYQQLTIIRKMVRDLDIPVDIIAHPTVREADGLAMSSRNVRLSPQDRAAAVVLNQAMNAADADTVETLHDQITQHITREPRAKIENLDIRDAVTLAPAKGPIAAPVVILLAVRFGDVLLIDQKVINPKAKS